MLDSNSESTGSKVFHWLISRVPPEYRNAYHEWVVETNLSRAYALSIFIIGIQFFLNFINMIEPGLVNDDTIRYVLLSLIALVIGIIFLVLSAMLRRGLLKSRILRRWTPFVLLYLYCAIQIIFLSLSPCSTGCFNSYIVVLILLGFLLVMPPVQCLLSVLSFFSVTVIMIRMNGDAMTWRAIFVADIWANLVIMTLLVLYLSCLVHRMYLTNFLSEKKLEQSNIQLEYAAQTDSLTGLPNRRGFYHHIDHNWGEYLAHQGVVAVYMYDIDHFKYFNDRLGHLVGDECLRQVGKTIRAVYTPLDGGLFCRFGGEEFLCVARLSSQEEALAIGEQVRRLVEALHIDASSLGSPAVITISGGVSILRHGNQASCDSLVHLADQALYQAKENGRNCICLGGSTPNSH